MKLVKSIIDYLNDNVNQESKILWVKEDNLLPFIRYDKDTIILLWACGAFVISKNLIYFISEDDGNWFLSDNSFHIHWLSNYIEGLNKALTIYKNKEKYEIQHWETKE